MQCYSHVQAQVFCETSLSGEPFTASVALVRLLPRVRDSVLFEKGLGPETLPTLHAGVRPPFLMNGLMSPQTGLGGEGLLAADAVVRSQSRVNLYVLLERVLLGESPPTVGAFMRGSVPIVKGLVPPETSSGGKALTTVHTEVRSLTCVQVSMLNVYFSWI